MKVKIFFSLLFVALLTALILWLFGNKINKNLEALSTRNVSFKNLAEAPQENSRTEEQNCASPENKIFNQIEKWFSIEELSAGQEENNNIERKKEIIEKVAAAVEKSNKPKEKISQEKVLLEKFKKELATNPNTICAGRVKAASTSSSQNCEGGADSSQCQRGQTVNDQNLEEEGGWGYSTGGEDSTTCCEQNSATQKCGEGDVQIPGKCQYSGDIYDDGPIIENVQCCSGCCVACREDCCSDNGCCVASCERKCEGRGYDSYIWNSVTKECGCGD